MTKTTIRTRPFDPAEYLKNEESVAAFVGDAIESGDPQIIQSALNTAARAHGMAQIAEDAGLGRESLYKALRPNAKPQFSTVIKVMGALGVKLVAKPMRAGPIPAEYTKRNVASAAKKVKSSQVRTTQKRSAAKRHTSTEA